MKLPLESITIGERRREDYGDIAGLAASMEKYGQLHPIVVDENGVLVAGGRRLRAAQLLGWPTIECHDIGEVSEAWREEIELAENEDRKDLTAYERAKASVIEARRVAKAISSLGEEKAPQGRKSSMDAPKADVAQAIGVSVGKLVKDEQHVAAAEKYPELQAPEVTQRAAIEIGKSLDVLPEPVREERRSVLRAVGPAALTLAAGESFPTGQLTPEQKAFYEASKGLMRLAKWEIVDPEMVANVPPPEAVHPTVVELGTVIDWLTRVHGALKAREGRPTLRTVKN
jgi:ParB-like chromosome segregation protein Spo0J